jgi:hypothetical protein
LTCAPENVAVAELDGDGGGAEIGGEDEVVDCGDQEDGEGDVVEDAAARGGDVGVDNGADEDEEVEGRDCPVEIGAVGGDVITARN